jgi:hypothetical protein
MYVILYFIKWRNENEIEKCKVLFTQFTSEQIKCQSKMLTRIFLGFFRCHFY